MYVRTTAAHFLPLAMRRPGRSPGRRRGLGAVAQAGNPNAGTYYDINCPNRCYVMGNVIDTSLPSFLGFGNKCWPCHNVCPPGTVWDTNVDGCSAAPVAPNPVVPITELTPDQACAASGGTYDPNTGFCAPPTPLDTSVSKLVGYIPWVVGGLVAMTVLPALLGGRR